MQAGRAPWTVLSRRSKGARLWRQGRQDETEVVIFSGGLFSTILRCCTYTQSTTPMTPTPGAQRHLPTRGARSGGGPDLRAGRGGEGRMEEARPGHPVGRRPESEASAGRRGSGLGLRILREKEKLLGTGVQGGRDYPSIRWCPPPSKGPRVTQPQQALSLLMELDASRGEGWPGGAQRLRRPGRRRPPNLTAYPGSWESRAGSTAHRPALAPAGGATCMPGGSLRFHFFWEDSPLRK